MDRFSDMYYSQIFNDTTNSRILVKPKKLSVFTINEEDIVPVKAIMPPKNLILPQADNLYLALRFFLRFGRLFGIIPLSGLMGCKSEQLRFSWQSLACAQSVFCILTLSVNAVVGYYNLFRANKSTASDVAFEGANAMFYSIGVLIYIYFLLNAEALVELLGKWRRLKPLHFSNAPGDVMLIWHANIIAVVLFVSAILENQLLFLLQSQVIRYPQEEHTQGTLFEVYYWGSHREWTYLYGGNDGYANEMGIFVYITNKLALYAWNFADILLILFSRALYFKFKLLNEVAESELVRDFVASNDPDQWRNLTYDFTTLCNLLKDFAQFLSPLVFLSFTVNIFFICVQVKLGLINSTNSNHIQEAYNMWSFLHLVIRVFLVSLNAARINEHVQATRGLLQLCPTKAYVQEVQRTDLQIATTQIGLTGFGCFVITKPFLLTVVGVIFTLEIVLLQTT